MKVLFAVSNEEISESIVKKYQKEYKEIISYKNVYYFNAILKELQKDKTYDRVVISEDLEAFTSTQYDQIDKFIFEKLDSISDEASNARGNDIPIILICSDRRTKSDQLLVKLFGIGIYDAIIGNDRSINEVCRLINRPRLKKEAKSYYKIDSEEVSYQAESENDVSEMEIQNIVAHYKRLGKNEEKYVDSFNNIAAQYNDTQLRIITKFLPLNVRAVLEEKSTKYQQIMSFNSSVSDSLRYNAKKEEHKGPSEKLLTQVKKENSMTEPIVIPSAVNTRGNVKLSRKKPSVMPEQQEVQQQKEYGQVQNTMQEIEQYKQTQGNTQNNTQNIQDNNFLDLSEIDKAIESQEENQEENKQGGLQEEPVTPVKRGRGRPRKNPIPEENTEPKVKRGRGRPRKNPIQEQMPTQEKEQNEEVFEEILPGIGSLNHQEEKIEDSFLPGFDDNNAGESNKEAFLPGFSDNTAEESNEDAFLPGFGDNTAEESNEDAFLPGFGDNSAEESSEEEFLPGFGDNNIEEPNEEAFLPGFDDNNIEESNEEAFLPGFNNNQNKPEETVISKFNETDEEEFLPIVDSNSSSRLEKDIFTSNNNENTSYYDGNAIKNEDIKKNNSYQSTVDISNLITPDKKIAAFVGTSKNGTSFIVNNVAEYVSSVMGIKTAILDTTKNRNSYYIYTKNEENLRNVAMHSMEGLTRGTAQGINVNKNLTVFTSLPNEYEFVNYVDEILETLLKNYSLILIDTDFDTPLGYFKQAQEIYLIQSYDILTIQPLTAFLNELLSKKILDETKLRIILNKVVKIKEVNEKIIIGGMSAYNDPAMSYINQLFDRQNIRYISIPFDQDIYTKYLRGIIECDINLKGYSKEFMEILRGLSSMIYPTMQVNNNNNTKYAPPSINNVGGQAFSQNMNSTLEQMRKKY